MYLEIANLSAPDIDRLVEALLFVADGPVSLEDLAKALEQDKELVEQATKRLGENLSGRGLRIARLGNRLQLTTAPDTGPAIERFLGISSSTKLSAAALESLGIVAYRQPITRAQIEAIRGVNSDGVIRTLLARSLIAPLGRLQQAGRPIILGTTFEFLQYFGIESLDELPKLPDLKDDHATPASDSETPLHPAEERPSPPTS